MSTEVQYRGFVYIKSDKENKRAPGLAEVRQAARLLEKPKKAQDVHPLFGRGFDTKLNLSTSEEGIVVTVPSDGENLVVMDHPMHKVVFVVSVKKTVYVVAKHELRGKGVMFKCHGFRVKSTDVAKALAQEIAVICNTVFKKLRQTRTFVRSQDSVKQPSVSAEGVPLRKKYDPDTRALKRIIAETRISVTQGNDHVEDVSTEDEEDAEKMLFGPEPEAQASPDFSVVDQIIRELQQSILAVDAAIERREDRAREEAQEEQQDEAEADEDDEEVAMEPQNIEFEEFSDDFARMTLCLHGETIRKRPMPKYAEVTLDCDLFDLTSTV